MTPQYVLFLIIMRRFPGPTRRFSSGLFVLLSEHSRRKNPIRVVVRVVASLVLFLAQLFCTIPSALAVEDLPKRLVISNSVSWVPYSFLDPRKQPKGLLIDLWRLFGEKNGVKITFKLVDWHDSLELIRRGQADVHGGLIMSELREKFLKFSQEIFRIRTLLFITVDSDVKGLSEMKDRPVGVVASSFEQEFITTYFPDVVLRPYPNSEGMVRAAVNGDIQAFVTDYPTGYYHLILMNKLDQFEARDTLFTEGIRVAVNKDSEALLNFINSGFAKITEAEKAAIRARWFIPGEPMPKWVLPTAIAMTVMVLLVALGGYYLSLRRTVQRRTETLNASIKKLETANAELNRLARIDSLTGLANRHHFYELAAHEMERVERYSRPLSLAVFDLDHFKRINDRYGHLAGDAALKKVAEVVMTKLRENDVFARLGGDEFAAMLPEANREDAAHLTKRIVEEVHHTSFEYQGQGIALSFSAGIAEYRNGDSIDQWIKRADDELYRSKALGRAKVSASGA
jgi:diguanylate cyclase (GGDEF)-like protein